MERGLVVENNPVRSSKSNGYIGRSIQGVEGMIRTWRSNFGRKVGSEARCGASNMALAGRMDSVVGVKSRGGHQWDDGVREV